MRRNRAACLLLAVAAAQAALGAGPIPPGVDSGEYLEATTSILCDCGCHPQSVYDCACGRADEMRAEIAAKIRDDGMTGEQVVAEYVAIHGEKILVAPPGRGFNLVAWLGPFAGLLLAAAALALLLRRWRRSSAAAVARAPAAGPSGEELERLERELREYE